MAAKEQLTAMEMIWGFMSGTTGHMGKTDFAPQKEAFGDFASPETYFPRVVPESEGISSEKLTQMLRELAAARHTDMHHLLVLRNGHVICECNFAPYRSGIWHATYSMCKSITGMAVGFLISEGKLSLDENVYDIFENDEERRTVQRDGRCFRQRLGGQLLKCAGQGNAGRSV